MTNNKPVINYCIWLVDSFECVKMHGPANPKSVKYERFCEMFGLKTCIAVE
jgi:hypothetical protein